MIFSTAVQKAFDGWINVSTWYTSHPLDEARFHSFVWAAVKDNCEVSESQIEQAILERWSGKLHNEYLAPAAQKWSSLYRELFDFGLAQPG